MSEQYQSFPGIKGASDSFAKLQRLGLPILKGKSFLDVGCNEGFFCEAARRAGASRVLGIDVSSEAISRAKKRYPKIEFRCQSWDKEIGGTFDVILIASALHYADDQLGLIKKLLNLLSKDGVLIIEIGLAAIVGNNFIQVRRAAGDIRSYPTLRLLEQSFVDYSVRMVGDSVPQSGDPIPRKVIHFKNRKPCLLLLDGPSYSGKSTLAKAMVGDSSKPRWVGLDELIRLIGNASITSEDEELVRKLTLFTEAHKGLANKILEEIASEGLIARFVDFILDSFSVCSADFILDGYVPPRYHNAFCQEFEARGYVVWSASPYVTRSWESLHIRDFALFGDAFYGFRSVYNIRLNIDLVEQKGDSIQIRGWSADLDEQRALSAFAVFVGSIKLRITGQRPTRRSDANDLTGISNDVDLGFILNVSSSELCSFTDGIQPLESKTSDKGSLTAGPLIRVFGYDKEGGVIEAHYPYEIRVDAVSVS